MLTDRAQLRTYECDGLANFRVTPAMVVLVESTQHVVGTVRLCAEKGVPFVARGAGTGLSGGALPVADGVLIVLSRMHADRSSRPRQRSVWSSSRASSTSWVTARERRTGSHYAPDPSSQQVCSIGGNVAENSGGAHCLKYGFTVNHVIGVDGGPADGEVVHLGGPRRSRPATTSWARSSAARARSASARS